MRVWLCCSDGATWRHRPRLSFLVGFILGIEMVAGMKVHAPDNDLPPPAGNPPPTVGGLTLPHIYVLNSTTYDPAVDPVYYDSGLSGASSFIFQNGTVFVATASRTMLSFQCEARYPVFWNLAHSNVHPNVVNALRVLSTRKFEDPFDPSSFTYVTTLSMTGPNSQLTGNYSCQCAARHEIQSSVYVFWESTFGNILVHSKENLTVEVKSKKEDIHLPCHVADPDARPSLSKFVPSPNLMHGETTEQEQPLLLNDSVLFSPMTGFTLKNLPNPLGTYKCSLDQNDYLFVSVQKPADLSPEQNYTISYDEDSKQVRCCANSKLKRPPKIYMMICEHPSTCGVREFVTTAMQASVWSPINQGRRRGNCMVLALKNMHNGVVKCVASGGSYSVFKEFIVPLEVDPVPWNRKRNTTTYFRWEEIDPQEMLVVTNPLLRNAHQVDLAYLGGTYGNRERKLQIDHTIYSKQQTQLVCHTSRYYFASGNYWAVRWKNQTMTRLDEYDTLPNKALVNRRHSLYYGGVNQHSNTVYFVAHSEMESVLCFAPVWNSSVWITKIYYLYVNESSAPLLSPAGDTNEVVHYTWYANETEKILSCSATGLPSPTFHWEKDNTTIPAGAFNFNVFQPNATNDSAATAAGSTKGTTTTTTAVPTTVKSGSDAMGTTRGSSVEGGEDIQADDGNTSGQGTGSKKETLKTTHSSLKINRISYNTRGVFRCVASNFGGKVVKEFHITVLEPKSLSATVFLVVSCILTVALMGGIIYLIRRLHQDRQEGRQGNTTATFPTTGGSTAVNFQNGGAIRQGQKAGGGAGSGGGASATAVSSTRYQQYHNNTDDESFRNSISFDNGKMTRNLIDAF